MFTLRCMHLVSIHTACLMQPSPSAATAALHLQAPFMFTYLYIAAIAIRGYRLVKNAGSLEIDVTEPGDYELSGDGKLTKLSPAAGDAAKEEL